MSSAADQAKAKMQATLEHFKQELKNLRTNRANTGMVEGVSVEVYGTHMRLKELASITVPEPRQILLTPFDPQTAQAIAKAVEQAVELRTVVEGGAVRVHVPPMDQAIRIKIVKQGKEKAESSKVAIREIRRKHNDLVREQKSKGEIPEDMMKKLEKEIQELTDQYCKHVDESFSAKEKEFMAV
jgi:ribosome recycling factor